MLDYYVYLAIGAVMLAFWLIAAYIPEIKAYIKKFMENNHWNFPHHKHG
jgi:hypothetical protein